MVLVFVVQTVADVLPMLAAVAGVEQRAIRANGETVVEVLEPDIQQRCFALQVLELFVPALAAIAAGEDLRIVADRPAVLLIDEEHRRQ